MSQATTSVRFDQTAVGRVVLVQAKSASRSTRAVVCEVSERGAACVVPLRLDGTPTEVRRWTGAYHSVRFEAA